MKAVGWCENCGDVEVKVWCVASAEHFWIVPAQPADHAPAPRCCQYADCPICGEDVDQWELVW